MQTGGLCALPRSFQLKLNKIGIKHHDILQLPISSNLSCELKPHTHDYYIGIGHEKRRGVGKGRGEGGSGGQTATVTRKTGTAEGCEQQSVWRRGGGGVGGGGVSATRGGFYSDFCLESTVHAVLLA